MHTELISWNTLYSPDFFQKAIRKREEGMRKNSRKLVKHDSRYTYSNQPIKLSTTLSLSLLSSLEVGHTFTAPQEWSCTWLDCILWGYAIGVHYFKLKKWYFISVSPMESQRTWHFHNSECAEGKHYSGWLHNSLSSWTHAGLYLAPKLLQPAKVESYLSP